MESPEEGGMTLLYALITSLLVLFAGLVSGLTIGLMAQDQIDLMVLESSGTERERFLARRILTVVKNPHFTLVTLLLCNAFALEALPIFLNKLVGELAAVIISVTIVLLFGEIIPQALCVRYALQIGAYSAPFVNFLRIITSPVSWPIAKFLDCVMGIHNKAIFKRSELKALVGLHAIDKSLGGQLTGDEVHIILSALDMHRKTARNRMKTLQNTYMLSNETVLDNKTITDIVNSGHSRIPVYDKFNKKDFIGVLLVKDLLLVDSSQNIKLSDISLRPLLKVPVDIDMFECFNIFRKGNSHMALLVRPPVPNYTNDEEPRKSRYETIVNGDPVGIVTLEDMIEELLQKEILDETDRRIDSSDGDATNIQTIHPTTLVRIANSRRMSETDDNRVVRFQSLRDKAEENDSDSRKSLLRSYTDDYFV